MRSLLKKAVFSLSSRQNMTEIPTLRNFLKPRPTDRGRTSKLTFHIQTYGCQMNVSDSEIVRSLLLEQYDEVEEASKAQILLLNTCSIREAAEDRVLQRIKNAGGRPVIAVLGCMAERLKSKMFQAGVQVVCGPDAYRDLPRLLSMALHDNRSQMNVMLSAQETYADIAPVRKNKDSVGAFLSIMRGCNNMCSYCIVPFVRGRERSRNLETILSQIAVLEKQGVKEITFLGQNVNSYHDTSSATSKESKHNNSEGFGQMYKLRDHPGARFADLLESAAERFPNIRFRFTSPHPKDFPEEVLQAIIKYPNICKHVHLPAQSGNNQVLERMRRNHTIEAYYDLVSKMRKIPGLALSTDLIAGFCGQTEQQFKDTLELIRKVKFEMAFLFSYSMREKTHAHRNYQDDVPEDVKQRRLKEMIDLFLEVQSPLNEAEIGTTQLLLIESKAKRDQNVFLGKTDHYKSGYAKATSLPVFEGGKPTGEREFKVGDFVVVRVDSVGPRALYCQPIAIVSTLSQYHSHLPIFQTLSEAKQIEKTPSTLETQLD